jgi:hypothetical protein
MSLPHQFTTQVLAVGRIDDSSDWIDDLVD